jgi:hypothetical protein
MPERDVITRAIDTYRRRWAVEEVHRQVKQSMKWEGMRLKRYRGMKNLNGFLHWPFTSYTSSKITLTELYHFENLYTCNAAT